MRLSILPRVFSPCQTECNTNKATGNINIVNEDGFATTYDESFTSSNSSTNGHKSSYTCKCNSKSIPRKQYPLLSSSSSPSTVPSKALPVRIQFALSMFIKRSTPQNWSILVNLLREKDLQCPSVSSSSWPHHDDEGVKRTLARLEKSLADELTVLEVESDEDELTVYEAEGDEEVDLGNKREEMAREGESVMEMLAAPKVPKLMNNKAPTKIKPRSRGSLIDESELDIPGSVANTFIEQPSTENWELLVQLFRNVNGKKWAKNKNAPHEILRVDSDLTFDEYMEAAMGENKPKALSIIYENDEEENESMVGLPETGGVVDHGSDESGGKVDEEQKEEHDRDREVDSASEGKWPEAPPFAGQLDWQLDWPCPDEREMMEVVDSASAVPSSPNVAQSKVPPSFSNTRAKAYVILWERRIRRFDQSQVNVVQKSRQGYPAREMQ